MPRTGDGPYVQSLDRGLAVLRCFGEDRTRLSISDVAREVGVDRAVARRLLHTLAELGYIGVDGSNFFVRPRVLELAQAYLGAVEFPDVIQPHLAQLTSEIHETAMAFVLDGDEIVYIAGVQARRLVSVNVRAGLRIPAYQSPLGHVLLAAQPADAREAYLERVALTPVTRYTITEKPARSARESGRPGLRPWRRGTRDGAAHHRRAGARSERHDPRRHLDRRSGGRLLRAHARQRPSSTTAADRRANRVGPRRSQLTVPADCPIWTACVIDTTSRAVSYFSIAARACVKRTAARSRTHRMEETTRS